MEILDVLQLAGSVGFLLALLPQFLHTLREGQARGVDISFLVLVLASSLVLLGYTIPTSQYFLAASYAGNLVVWGTVLWYRLRPRGAPAA